MKKTEYDDAPEKDESEAYSDTEIVTDLEAEVPVEKISTLHDFPDFLLLGTQ